MLAAIGPIDRPTLLVAQLGVAAALACLLEAGLPSTIPVCVEATPERSTAR
ncbi:MAG: hypothetical protein H0W21_04915 [Actinobacteria bacterium]|nr:hypothetical protein [Actinomycetota bacterium]